MRRKRRRKEKYSTNKKKSIGKEGEAIMKNVWLLESKEEEEEEGGVGRSNSIVTRDTQKQKGARRSPRRQERKKIPFREKTAGT